MGDLRHELSWSASRAATFDTCARRYYYDYYASWLGWERNAPPERRRPYLLKKMTRMPMLAGDCLHIALADWFSAKRAGRVGDATSVRERAVGLLRERYKESRDGLWAQRPAKLTRLAEHHYGEPDLDEASGAAARTGKRAVERIEKAVDTFFAAEELAPVRESDPADWLALEELGTIQLCGTNTFAIPDFAHRVGDEVWLWDWKTGTPREQDRFQLGVYVLYARERFAADPARVRCIDAYLTRNEFVDMRLGPDELEALLERIAASMSAMRELHFDADRSLGDPSAFPLLEATENQECATCNYRELCSR